MASTERKTKQRAEHVCSVCKQPVETELKRHKTLGIFVPIWGPGPCHNPDCAAAADGTQQARHQHGTHR